MPLTNGNQNPAQGSSSKNIHTGVIIVGGGSGTRMKSELPKQFLPLDNKPIIVHTVEIFLKALKEAFISVALPHTYWEYWFEHCSIHFTPEENRRISLARGGLTRSQTVWNAMQTYRLLRLANVNSGELGAIGVHDAVRPFVSENLIQRCFQTNYLNKGIIPTLSINYTMRRVDSFGKTFPVDRDDYLEVQTPQVFSFIDLWKAYERRVNPSFPDDASIFEDFWMSKKFISTVEGEKDNIKITTPEDYEWAQWKILQNKYK